MVTRHRLNLSLSDGDYQRLVDLANAEGKMPTTFAMDCLKAVLHARGVAAPKRVKTIQEPFSGDVYTRLLPGVDQAPTGPQNEPERSFACQANEEALRLRKIAQAQEKRDRKAAKRGA